MSVSPKEFVERFRIEHPGVPLTYQKILDGTSREDLRGADLSGVDLQDADLSGADLQDADLQGALICEANLEDANLEGANLEGTDLWGTPLYDANLSDADLWALICGSPLPSKARTFIRGINSLSQN